MGIYHDYCQTALDVLYKKYEATKIINHAATAGAQREDIIKDFLRDHLPEIISICSGQIIDSNNLYSKQQDVVFVLNNLPRLKFFSHAELIFAEGVVATIEIKTNLNNASLQMACENIKSVKDLNRNVLGTTQMGVTHSWPPNKILTVIVAYDSVELNILAETICKLNIAKPDLVFVLSKGLLIQNHELLFPKQEQAEYLIIGNAAEGFKILLTFLTEITGTLSSRIINWREYWK